MNVFITGLQLILVILKVTGYIEVSWIIVFLPTILLVIILGVCLLAMLAGLINMGRRNRKNIKKLWKDMENDETESDSHD